MLYGPQSSEAEHPHQLFSARTRRRPTGLLQSVAGRSTVPTIARTNRANPRRVGQAEWAWVVSYILVSISYKDATLQIAISDIIDGEN